MYIGK